MVSPIHLNFIKTTQDGRDTHRKDVMNEFLVSPLLANNLRRELLIKIDVMIDQTCVNLSARQ